MAMVIQRKTKSFFLKNFFFQKFFLFRYTSSILETYGGEDVRDLGESESVLVAFDLGSFNSPTPDGVFDIIVGVHGGAASSSETPSGCTNATDISCFGVYRYRASTPSLYQAPRYVGSDILVQQAPHGRWKNWVTVNIILCFYNNYFYIAI